MWCTDELETLLEEKNIAWDKALDLGINEDWIEFRRIAAEFVDKVREAKTKAWQEFASTLNYNKNTAELINIVKAINREEQ
eukprot:2725651-Ditylum_brightwellii.AAC.1